MGKVRVRKREKSKNIVVNIDYDKLADAVYRANLRSVAEIERLEKEKIQEEIILEQTKRFSFIKFLKGVRNALFRKNTEVKFIGPWMGLIVSIFLILFGVISFFAGLWVFISGVQFLFDATWQNYELIDNIIIIAIGSVSFVFLFSISLFSFCAAGELPNEKDKNFLATLFSGIVGLAAMFIALISIAIGVMK